MPPRDDVRDWLGDLRWEGYPRLDPIADAVAKAEAAEDSDGPGCAPHSARDPKSAGGQSRAIDPRAAALARENEALRARIEAMTRLASEFERRLSEAGSAYEGAVLEAESARRAAELERERLAGELESARAELGRRQARETARDAELTLERERRADCEKALIEARRRLNDLEEELARARAQASELAGGTAELRRQADAGQERLVQAKALTDQDVALLRQEMREFLAKFHRIQESLGE